VQINLGSVVNGFLKPIFSEINDIVAPIRPVLDFLSTDLPIIGVSPKKSPRPSATASTWAFIDAIRYVSDMSAMIANTGPDVWLDLGSFNVNRQQRTSAGGTITPLSAPDLGTQPQRLQRRRQHQELRHCRQNRQCQFPSQHPRSLHRLQPAHGSGRAPRHLRHPDLTLAASYSQFFSVFGHAGMRISGDLKRHVARGFGYDTYGLREARDTGNWSYLLDGFYVTNRQNADGTGPVVPTIRFGVGLSAAAELNLGIASGGVSGGINGEMDLTLVDPTTTAKSACRNSGTKSNRPAASRQSTSSSRRCQVVSDPGVVALQRGLRRHHLVRHIYQDTFLAPRRCRAPQARFQWPNRPQHRPLRRRPPQRHRPTATTP